MRFDAAQVPKTKAFWSLTLYDKDFYLPKGLVPNRHVLNSNSGLVFGADGSLEIYVQAKSPGAEHEANWLPAPEGEFFMILRSIGRRGVPYGEVGATLAKRIG